MKSEGKKTLLLVEDEMLIAMAQKIFLEKYGYKVFTTNTGEKAIEILKQDCEIELALVPESKKHPLENFGYHVLTANTPEKAIELFKSNSEIDLVLMDIDLGSGIDGTEAAEHILRHRDIPILFLSSHTEPEIVEKTERISSYGYVVKDSSITVLDASIKMALKLFTANQKLHRELVEREKINEQLQVSEARYRRLFETTQTGILILDAETGMILDVNPFLVSLLGYSYELFMGKAIWDIGILKDIVGNKEKFIELQASNYVRYENLPLQTASAAVIEVEFISNVYDVGDAKVIQCNIRDISERRRIECGLEQTRKELVAIKLVADDSSEFSQSVINTVREPLLALDQDLRVVKVSRSFYEVFKTRPEDTIGRLVYDLGNKQWDIPRLRMLLEEILPEHASFDDYEVDHDFTTIGRRIMLLNARQIRQVEGKRQIILLAIEDITERKEAERRIKALLDQKDLILKEVHHRIKNSMNTLRVLLALQIESLKEPSAIAALENAEGRVASMMMLYDKLYRSADYKDISVKTYLSPLVDEILGNFPNSATITVEKHIDDFTIDGRIIQAIGIIINELLTNIMKYAFTGRSEGSILVVASLADGRGTIRVKDDGRGIPDDFDFERSSGFGLLLIRTLTEQIGGTIKIERDCGTSVVFDFTVQKPPACITA